MVHCIECGAELPDDANFCSRCGAEVVTKDEGSTQHGGDLDWQPSDKSPTIYDEWLGIWNDDEATQMIGAVAIWKGMFQRTGLDMPDSPDDEFFEENPVELMRSQWDNHVDFGREVKAAHLSAGSTGTVSVKNLTKTEGMIKTYLYDRPLVDYLVNEQVEFFFRNENSGLTVENTDESETNPFDSNSGNHYLLVTEHRVIYVSGDRDGDCFEEFSYNEIEEVESSTGFANSALGFTLQSGAEYTFAAVKNSGDIEDAEEYITEQTSRYRNAGVHATESKPSVLEELSEELLDGPFDRTDGPIQVSESFINALNDSNFEAADQYLHPESPLEGSAQITDLLLSLVGGNLALRLVEIIPSDLTVETQEGDEAAVDTTVRIGASLGGPSSTVSLSITHRLNQEQWRIWSVQPVEKASCATSDQLDPSGLNSEFTKVKPSEFEEVDGGTMEQRAAKAAAAAEGRIKPEMLSQLRKPRSILSGIRSEGKPMLFEVPLIAHVREGEQPQFLLSHSVYGLRVTTPVGEEYTPHHAHETLGRRFLMFTDERILYVAGYQGEDFVTDLDYGEVRDYTTGHDWIELQVEDGTKYKFASDKISSTPISPQLTSYLDEQLTVHRV